MVPGEVTEITFELPNRLHTFLESHRLMVHVQITWFPIEDRNPQTFFDIYSVAITAALNLVS